MLITLVKINRPGAKGDPWRVIDKRQRVAFSDRNGPWLLIVPAGRPPEDIGARWVHGIVDEKFKILPGHTD